MKKESVLWEVELISDDGDPGGFLDDLPRYYAPLEEILNKHLYLADKELTQKALEFIRWVNVARSDPMRFDKIMSNTEKLDDALIEFRQCVIKKYEIERKVFVKKL